MEKSTLYDVLSIGVIQKWRRIEEEQDDYFTAKEQELREELTALLNETSLSISDTM